MYVCINRDGFGAWTLFDFADVLCIQEKPAYPVRTTERPLAFQYAVHEARQAIGNGNGLEQVLLKCKQWRQVLHLAAFVNVVEQTYSEAKPKPVPDVVASTALQSSSDRQQSQA